MVMGVLWEDHRPFLTEICRYSLHLLNYIRHPFLSKYFGSRSDFNYRDWMVVRVNGTFSGVSAFHLKE